MWKCVIFLYSLGTVLAQSAGNDSCLINIAQGAVRGHLEPDGSAYGFYNIPYATAPTGVDRFKAPLSPPVWMGTFDAVDRRIRCPQPFGGANANVQEDCLVANVFIPTTNETNLPVVVIVHGGAYQYGAGNDERLTALVQTSKLIAVSFNYRLGAHGFLCLGTEGAPGNAGLKDQIALLRWVNANIASFGGNPRDVTLLGCSAGGGSIDMLTLSRLTNGLYHKAIVDSGSSFGGVGVQSQPIVKAQNYARLLNFTNVEDLSALEEFYKTISFQQLYSLPGELTGHKDATITFAPCLERDIGQERVLIEPPIDVIKQGNYTTVPLLYGFANMEGLIRIFQFESWRTQMNEHFSDFLPSELYFESKEAKERVADIVKKFYFGDELVSEANILSYIDYFTDVVFAYPMLKSLKARIESQDDTIYLHKYSFVDENTPSIPHTDVRGAHHCDQTLAVLDEDETNLTDEYRRQKAIMREYWLNFILTGVPSVSNATLPVWLPANANRAPYMSFGTTIELNSSILLEERAALWDEVYQHHYRGPIAPAAPGASAFFSSSKILTSSVLLLLFIMTK